MVHSALVQAAGEVVEETHISPWAFGGLTLAVFLVLLFVVTRFNIDR